MKALLALVAVIMLLYGAALAYRSGRIADGLVPFIIAGLALALIGAYQI